MIGEHREGAACVLVGDGVPFGVEGVETKTIKDARHTLTRTPRTALYVRSARDARGFEYIHY